MENESNQSPNPLMNGLDWIVTLAYLNILWIAFSLLGLIFFGIGPSTLTLYALIRQKLREGKLTDVFRKYKTEYRKQLNPGNVYFPIILGVGIVLYINYQIIGVLPSGNSIQIVLTVMHFVFTAIAILSATFTIGYYVDSNESVFTSLQQGGKLTLMSPVPSLVILLAVLLQLLLSNYLSFFILIFSMSLYAFITEWIMNKALNRLILRDTKIEKQ